MALTNSMSFSDSWGRAHKVRMKMGPLNSGSQPAVLICLLHQWGEEMGRQTEYIQKRGIQALQERKAFQGGAAQGLATPTISFWNHRK